MFRTPKNDVDALVAYIYGVLKVEVRRASIQNINSLSDLIDRIELFYSEQEKAAIGHKGLCNEIPLETPSECSIGGNESNQEIPLDELVLREGEECLLNTVEKHYFPNYDWVEAK